MNSLLHVGIQSVARSPKVTSGDSPKAAPVLAKGEGVPVSAARIRLNGVERPVLTVMGESGVERRWMRAEAAPRSGLIVGGERNGLLWPTQAYRVVSWEESGMGYDGADFESWVRVKFEPLGRVFYAR